MTISRCDGDEEEWRTHYPPFSAATAVERPQPRKRRLKLASSSSSLHSPPPFPAWESVSKMRGRKGDGGEQFHPGDSLSNATQMKAISDT